ncbi:MAG TPA: hypothetical protein VGJ81_19825 [Thermoanaerobaculia bacterium]|jgi:hypothetical protein
MTIHRTPLDPLSPLDEYLAVQHVLRQARLMERFFEDFVDENPMLRPHLPEMHCAYMDMLNEQLAPYALILALAITELEDAYPEIERPGTPR